MKKGLAQPTSYKGVIQNAVHLLNSVTIPEGDIIATDSGEGEGNNDHTVFGLVYDHTPDYCKVFFRSYDNQSLQRIELGLLGLDVVGGESRYLPVVNKNDWFFEASGTFGDRPSHG